MIFLLMLFISEAFRNIICVLYFYRTTCELDFSQFIIFVAISAASWCDMNYLQFQRNWSVINLLFIDIATIFSAVMTLLASISGKYVLEVLFYIETVLLSDYYNSILEKYIKRCLDKHDSNKNEHFTFVIAINHTFTRSLYRL